MGGGYSSITLDFSHNYRADATNNTSWYIKITPGIADCTAGTSWHSITDGVGVNLPALNAADLATTRLSRTFAATDFPDPYNAVVICMQNNTNPSAKAVGVWYVRRQDTGPDLVYTPPATDYYRDPVSVTLTCSEYAFRIAVTQTSQQTTSPADPAPPAFDADTGLVTVGSSFTGGSATVIAPNPANPTRTKFTWRCIDVAGNLSSTALNTNIEYYVDTTIPAVTLVPDATYHDFVSSAGYTTTTIRFTTDQAAGEDWVIKKGGSCASGGTVMFNGTVPGPGQLITQTLSVGGNATTDFNVAGEYDIRVCVHRALNDTWGTAYRLITRDDDPPSLFSSVPSANYGAVQNVSFSCSNNADVISYTIASQLGKNPPAAPGNPPFTANGPDIVTGPVTPPDSSTSILRVQCRDKAGNFSAIQQLQYTIDATLPNITFVSNERNALSNAGGYSTSQLTWHSTRANLPFEIRRNVADCSGGPGLGNPNNILTGTTGDPASNMVATLLPAHLPVNNTNYSLKICVFNYLDQPTYQAATISVYRDDTPPTILPINLTPSIASAGATNYTLTWNAADDTGGSGVAVYRIFRGTSPGVYPGYPASPDYTVAAIVGVNSATVAVPDTQTYYLRIVPVDLAGNVTALAGAYSELATRLNLTVSVTGYAVGSGDFRVEQGGDTLIFNSAPGGSQTFTTGFTPGASYSVNITAQPGRQNCAFTSDQYGTINSNLTLQVTCVTGYLRSGAMTLNRPVSLGYHLYRGNAAILAGGGSGSVCPGSNAANCFDGVGVAARFNNPHGMTIVNGVIYIADRENNRIRKYDIATNTTATFAGEGSPASTDGTGTGARINKPQGITSDGVNLFIAESPSSPDVAYIRRINIATQQVTTIAGGASVAGGASCPGTAQASCRDGSAFQALFGLPNDIDYHNGYLYISEYGNNRIRRMSLATGQVETIVGDGTATSADHTTGTSASINGAAGLTVLGNMLYAVDFNGHRIRSVSLTAPYAVTTLVGTGTAGHTDGPFATARFSNADYIFGDGRDLYVTEYGGNRLRRINLAKNIVSTIAGSGGGSDAAGIGPAASFAGPVGIVSDGSRFFVMSYNGGRLFRVNDAGLVGFWPIEPGVNPNDYASDKTTALNGSLSGSLGTLTGRYSAATDSLFNGTSHRMSAGTIGLPAANSPRTMCAWVKPTAAPTATHLIATYGSTAVNQSFGIVSAYSGGVEHVGLSGYGADLLIPHVLPTTNWTHLCAWTDGTNGRLYLNGKAIGSYAHTFATGSAGMSIGAQLGDLQYFGGGIADVRLYNRALDEGEINELAQDASGTATVGPGYNTAGTGLLAHYEFRGGIPAVANLQPSGPLGGVLGNTASSPTGKDGDNNGSAYFSGGSNLPGAPTGLPSGNAPRTMCAYISPQSYPSGTFAYSVSYGDVAVFSGFGLGIKNAGGGVYQIANTFSSGSDNLVTFRPSLNSWSHLCATYDGAISRLYFNGVFMGSQPATLATVLTSFRIGSWLDNSQNMQGKIDDVRIYNRALSAVEVRQLATQVSTGLVARYEFNDTDGVATADDLFDASGFGNPISGSSPLAPTPTEDRFGVAYGAQAFTRASAQYLNAADATILTPVADITISAWIKPRSLPASNTVHGIVSKMNAGGAKEGFALELWNNAGAQRIYFWNGGGAGDAYSVPYTLPRHVYSHITFTRTGTVSRFYVNGAQIGVASEATVAGRAASINPLIIGSRNDDLVDHSFDGVIDDVRIYNRALADAEIRVLAGYHVLQTDSGLRFHVQADNFSDLLDGATISRNWQDTAFTPYNPTGQGQFYNDAGDAYPRFVKGANSLLGGKPAVEFAGGNEAHFDFGAHSVTYSGFTVCAAVTRKDVTYAGLIEKRNAANPLTSWGILTEFSGSDALKFEIGDPPFASTATAMADDTPTIYCIVGGGASSIPYINGTAAAAMGGTVTGANNAALYVGRRYSGAASYYGQIGDIFMMEKDATAADLLLGQCYLSAKYSIPLSVVCP